MYVEIFFDTVSNAASFVKSLNVIDHITPITVDGDRVVGEVALVWWTNDEGKVVHVTEWQPEFTPNLRGYLIANAKGMTDFEIVDGR
tara:strand:- start:17 stop:277 length:261 start_codon:yes stop_codon:yes gene_type:complete